MASAQKQYSDEMKKKFGYYATWNPGYPLELGDYGILKDNVFTRLSNIKDLGVEFDVRPDSSKVDLEHNSYGSVQVTTKLSGVGAPVGSTLTELDAGIIVEFSRENSVLFKANNTTSPSIGDSNKVGIEIVNLYKEGKWNPNWVVITELINAESATILISNSSNSKIELRATANIDTPSIDIASADFKFSTQLSRGLATKIIAKEGIKPLFKVMGMKTRIVGPPIFKLANLNSFDLLTPATAKNNFIDDIYFGYISDHERE